MAKQLSLKQQLINQLAQQTVAQLQQPQQNDLSQLQAEYDAWNNQQQLQNEYDAWLKSQQPVQEVAQPIVQPTAKPIPTLKSAAEVEAFRNQKIANRAPILEQIAATKEAERQAQAIKNNATNETLNRLGVMTQMGLGQREETPKVGEGINQIDLSKYNLPEAERDNNLVSKSLDLQRANELLDPNHKLTKDEQKEAKRIANINLNTLSNHGKISRNEMSPENQELYDIYKNLETKSSGLRAFAIGAADKALDYGKAILQGVANTQSRQLSAENEAKQALGLNTGLTTEELTQFEPETRQNINQFNEDTAYARSLGTGAAPLGTVNLPVLGQKEITPYGVGQTATQLAAYGATNHAFDMLGLALGAGTGITGKVAGFVGNQLGQNMQDYVLDTTLVMDQVMNDPTLTDQQRADAILESIEMNGIGNLGAYGLLKALPEGIAMLVKKGLDNKVATEATEDVVANAAKQYADAAAEIERLSKQIPAVDEVTESSNKQFSDLMNTFNSQFKDESAMKNIFTPEDLEAAQNAQFKSLMDENLLPERLNPQVEMEGLEEALKEAEELKALQDELPTWGTQNLPTVKNVEDIAPKKTGYTQSDYQEILDKYRAGERLTQYEDEALQSALLEEKYDNLRRYSNDSVTVEKSDIPDDVLKYIVGENYENQPDSVKLSAELAKRGFNIWENGFNNNIMQGYGDLIDAVSHYSKGENIPAELMADAYDITYKNGGSLYDAIELAAEMNAPKKLLPDDLSDQIFYYYDDLFKTYGNSNPKLENKNFSIPTADINTFEKDGKTFYQVIDTRDQRVIKEYKTLKAAEKAKEEFIAGDVPKQRAIDAYKDIGKRIYDYETALFKEADQSKVDATRRAVEAARKRYERAMKDVFPSYYDDVSGQSFAKKINDPYKTRFPKEAAPAFTDDELDAMFKEWDEWENSKSKYVRDAEPIEPKRVAGADPLQTFAEGPDGAEWKISKGRTNTIEKLGWGDQMPEKDFAYRVYSEAEQRADAAARYADSQNVVADLMNKSSDEFDAPDVKMAFNESQRLLDNGDKASVMDAQRLMRKTIAAQREGARVVQASAEYTRDTAMGALGDAMRFQEDNIIEPWKSSHTKAREGNSRIAKALEDMGNKWKSGKGKAPLTHEQIKNGVIAEIEREYGSVSDIFNDNDIEFLTTLAEDRSIPIWQITSEIEHRLNTGKWYTLDESLPIPKPTNSKLNSALNSLIENDVRAAEKTAPDLKQITEEVRNTLERESSNFEGKFTDDDVDYLANLINNGATKAEIADALDMKLATGSFGISEETMQQVNSIFKEISNFDPNSKQFVEGQAEAYRLLANELAGDASAWEKFEAWRYLAMLGNPKTMLRNFIGNQTFGAVTGVSNNIAALAEAGIDKGLKAMGGEGIQRTKSVLNPVKDMDLIKAAAEDADASRFRQISGSKYEKMDADTLRQSKSVFNSKLAQLYEKVTDAGISDYQAVKNKFSTSLAGYLKANGYDTNIFKAEDELARLKNLADSRVLSDAEKDTVEKLTKEVADLEKARDYALKQAEYATFHEDNKIAKTLSNWSRTSKEEGSGIGHVLIEGTVPFKKTPANVLRSGYEYSPLGAISSLKKTGKLIYENTGKRAGNLADTYKVKKLLGKGTKDVNKELAADVIDSWSKTLTGTGMTALGFYLYDKGILNSSDKDLKYQDQLEGKQNYSITINGKTYTIDWAAPAAMPLLLGAEVAKTWSSTGQDIENWYDHLDEYLNTANTIAEPLVETSMLSGVRDTLKEISSSVEDNDYSGILGTAAYNMATGFATQAIPTISGQIARTVDNTRRTAYTDKEGVAGTLEKQGRKLMNKIPGLSTLNQPYIDTYGREQKNSPFDNPVANLAYQMASPGYLADINTTDSDKMAREVFEDKKNKNVLPKWQSYFKDDEGNRVSPEDYTKASRAYGEAELDIRNTLANDEWFNGLDKSQQTEIVKGINGIAEHVGKAAIDPEYETSSKAYTAYKEGGIPSLVDYYKNEVAKSDLKGMSDGTLTAGSNAGKEALDLIKEGKTEEAQKVIDAEVDYTQAIKDTGLSKSDTTREIFEKSGTQGLKTLADFQSYGKDNATEAYKRYETAKQQIPGLTVGQYKSTVNKMDGLVDNKKNGQISQKEMLAYLNNGDFTQEEAEELWKNYGNEWKTSVAKNKNGQWTSKRNK